MTIDWQQIAVEHGNLSIESATFLGEGWTSRAFLVNGQLVFRFPKRDEVWSELEREMAFLAATANAFPLLVPRYRYIARQSAGAAYGYAVYDYVPGEVITLTELTMRERSAAAEAIAGFLLVLHGLRPPSSIAPHEWQVDDERNGAMRLLAEAERVIVPQLSSAQAASLRDEFSRYEGTPASFTFQPVVIHADFSRDHILASERVVSGVIDFADVSVGDPDYDFSSLFMDFGNGFTVDVAQRYGHSNLEQLRAKLRYFNVADLIDTILHGDGWALEGEQEEAWRRLLACLR